MDEQRTLFYPHKVGDGLHYITDNFRIFEDGSFQLGETSEPCILMNLHLLCSRFDLPQFWELWNLCYPNDPMDFDDAVTIIGAAVGHMVYANPNVPDDRADIIKDLRDIDRTELASLVTDLLDQQGVLV